jgi:glycosyltransferase involved in cell wall biosynthesis
VINEAFNQRLPALATDAVGAAAGGLVRTHVNGLVVPGADAGALADAIGTLAADPQLRARMGSAGAEAVRPYTYAAWAEGFSQAFASVGVSRRLTSTGAPAGPSQPADSSADVGSFR